MKFNTTELSLIALVAYLVYRYLAVEEVAFVVSDGDDYDGNYGWLSKN